MKRTLALSLLAFLAACGTPQEQCIARETRDLRTLDRLIGETEANIARGYALVEYRTSELVPYPCFRARPPNADGSANPPDRDTCFRRETDIDVRSQSIDLNAERAKLASMRDKRRDLARRAEAQVAACRAAYPE